MIRYVFSYLIKSAVINPAIVKLTLLAYPQRNHLFKVFGIAKIEGSHAN